MDEIEIHLDFEGANFLIKKLEALISKRTDHIHLMSENWGGHDLESNAIGDGNDVFHHVKIYFNGD